MLNHYSITKLSVSETFSQSLWQARREALIAKLLGKTSRLKSYEESSTDKTWQKRYLGMMTIPTLQITGTVGRHDDFDGRFRPLKPHLKERWVNVALRSQDAGWPPIEVIKAGDDYFVIDGHHRTSFAHSTGMAFIEAEVWEMIQKPAKRENSQRSDHAAALKPIPALGVLSQRPADCCRSTCVCG
jgi:hypothetical protein